MKTLVSNLGVRCRNHQGGCHWIGPSESQQSHEEVCLVNHLLAWQHEAECAEVAKRQAEDEICCLKQSLLKLEKEIEDKDAIIDALRAPLAHSVVEVGVQCHRGRTQQKPLKRDGLLVATRRGDINSVEGILAQEEGCGVDINAVNTEEGRSALHLAVSFGYSSIAEMLLESDRFIAVSASDKEENTALHLACLHGRTDVVHMLLSSSRFSGVSQQNQLGRTALHCAALHGHSQEVGMLLNSERFSTAAVNAPAVEELTIRMSDGHTEALLEDGFTALHVAAKFAPKHGTFE